jgi:large subunit ribosomal protein L35
MPEGRKPGYIPEHKEEILLQEEMFVQKKRKTSKSAAKRFKVTGTGKILRRHSHARHILTKKPRKRVRKLVDSALVSKPDRARIKRMLDI